MLFFHHERETVLSVELKHEESLRNGVRALVTPYQTLTTLDFLITQSSQSSLMLKPVYVELCAICIKNKNIKCYK